MSVEIPQFARTGVDIVHRKIVHPYLTRGKAREDREVAHERALDLMESLQNNPLVMKLLREMFVYEDPILETNIAGVKLPNPIIMPAGFDKKVRVHKFLGEAAGFGAVTEGTITKIPYIGNDQPRIFDLPQSDGLINRMVFPGDGSDEGEKRLQEDNPSERDYGLFVSIGASKPSFENGTEIEDFVSVAKQLIPYGDGQEQNISSPNTKGVLGLGARYEELASALNQEVYIPYSIQLGGKELVVLAKISPDLARKDRQSLIRIGHDNGVKVIVLGNTSVDSDVRSNLDANDIYREEAGGISGQPIRQKALENSHEAYVDTDGEIPIIMAGGIKTAEDVWNALTYGGASAVGIYTAFVRPNSSTPNFVYYLLKDLARAMRVANMQSIDDFKYLRGAKVAYPLSKK